MAYYATGDEFESFDPEEFEGGYYRQQAPMGSGSVVLDLYHAFGEDALFEPRGQVEVGVATLSKQVTVRFVGPSANAAGTHTLPDHQIEQLEELVRNGGYYRLRLRMGPDAPWVGASVSACQLHRASFREEITLQLDLVSPVAGGAGAAAAGQQGGGGGVEVLGLRYAAVPPPLATMLTTGAGALACSAAKLPSSVEFTTTLQSSLPTQAQSIPVQVTAGSPPPGVARLAKFQAQGEDGKGGQQNQSFLRKYWYIVVPLVLLFLMNPQQPEGAPGGGGQGG
eukprot:CAMPEP_0113936808 /NCGR_PEP_ID=MMETSP1339-20121228/3598_1 /TAXON_ID=94617 /ORGANISM="Fibrocapsa japonica" /LENGTH=280 /DNA_ID=CAMNT_0000939367 /DNA_START=101 /DNA_END=940 /DNA_ORIENTATION=- /assembly_acc=CAM_ASM_000762